MEHEAQPHQGDQHQLIEKEVGDHGKTPSYRWRNEGILPGFAGYRISRKIEVQDRFFLLSKMSAWAWKSTWSARSARASEGLHPV